MDIDAASAQTGRPRPEDWFAAGSRRAWDPATSELGPPGVEDAGSLHVWERTVGETAATPETAWTTFLPGFPDGSYGFAHMDAFLSEEQAPRLYVEFVGQGDSDKPRGYPYSTQERADLVEATWRAHGIERTSVVAFDYGSLAILEILARRLESRPRSAGPRIDRVVVVNGGLFVDGHTHPLLTTPLLASPMGAAVMWAAQRSRRLFTTIVKSARMWSSEFGVTRQELADEYDVMTRRGGAHFLHSGARFVSDHRAAGERTNFGRIFRAFRSLHEEPVRFLVAGTEQDPYEHRQIALSRERLAPLGLDVRTFPGGHLMTSEHPDLLAGYVREALTRPDGQSANPDADHSHSHGGTA